MSIPQGPLTSEVDLTDLAVFGSVATGKARRDSDIDLLVRAPKTCTIADDIRREAVLR